MVDTGHTRRNAWLLQYACAQLYHMRIGTVMAILRGRRKPFFTLLLAFSMQLNASNKP